MRKSPGYPGLFLWDLLLDISVVLRRLKLRAKAGRVRFKIYSKALCRL